MYFDAIKDYCEYFPKLKVFFYEELKEDPESLVKDIYAFLGVDTDYKPESLNKVFHSSGEPKNAFLKPIYHFVMEKNILKDLLKMVISEKMRSDLRKLKSDITRKITRTKTVNYKNKNKLFDKFYREDVEKLYQFFKESEKLTRKAEFLERWMT